MHFKPSHEKIAVAHSSVSISLAGYVVTFSVSAHGPWAILYELSSVMLV